MLPILRYSFLVKCERIQGFNLIIMAAIGSVRAYYIGYIWELDVCLKYCKKRGRFFYTNTFSKSESEQKMADILESFTILTMS